jgi:hypothetical protein
MTLSTVKEELEAAKWDVSQAQKELSKYHQYNESGKDYVVMAAKRELEWAFQRINRALMIDSGKEVEVPR